MDGCPFSLNLNGRDAIATCKQTRTFLCLRQPPRRESKRQARSITGWRTMRVRLKGINRNTKRLADGRTVTYFYAWKGGPPLRGEPGSPEFIASYNEAVSRKITPQTGVLSSILQQFRESEAFGELAKRTKSDYLHKIQLI